MGLTDDDPPPVGKWYVRAGVFALKAAIRPLLESMGQKIGDAVGSLIGKRLNPGWVEDECNEISEDERTD